MGNGQNSSRDDSIELCLSCRKRRPNLKEGERIRLARLECGQQKLEQFAVKQGYQFCVCPQFESVHDLVESEKGEDALSREETEDFEEIERAVGPDPRVRRPDWCNDDLAVYLVLCSQYPFDQIESMQGLIRRHLRGTTPMNDAKIRQQMLRLRARAEEFFAQAHKGPVSVSDAARHSRLLTLKRKGRILRYETWKSLSKRRRRYKMNPSDRQLTQMRGNLEALVEEFAVAPHKFPFMSARGFEVVLEPNGDRLPSSLSRVSSGWSLLYFCSALLERVRDTARGFAKRLGLSEYLADCSIAAIFLSSVVACGLAYNHVLSRWKTDRWYYRHVLLPWSGPPVISVNGHLAVNTARSALLVQLIYPLGFGFFCIESLLLLCLFWLLVDWLKLYPRDAAVDDSSLLTFRLTKR